MLSRPVIIAIAAVVVVVVVVVGLGLAGIIPGLTSSSGGGGGSGGASYSVTFSESGLAGGTSWSVTLAGAQKSSSSATIVFSEQNGSYSFTVGSVAGYTAGTTSGTVTVNGGPVTKTVTFTPLPPGIYAVTFSESGLPSTTSWSVTFNGTTLSSTGTSIGFTAKNGSWPFTAGTVSGYTPSPASGHVVVNGAPATQTITYTSSGGGGGGGQTSYSQEEPIAVSAANAQGAGWKLWFAAGEDLTSAYSNSSTPGTNASCQVTGGSGTWPTIPAWTGTYSNGKASGWAFFFYNSSHAEELWLVVIGSTATILGTISGSNCVPSSFSYLTGLGLSGIIDSTTAAAAITSNDSAYVAAHASADASYTLLSGASYLGLYTTYPSWLIDFTTCSPSGGGTGQNFSAVVNASSGHVVSNSTSSGPCGHPNGMPHQAPAGVASLLLRWTDLQIRRP
jgi:hypothetical protein